MTVDDETVREVRDLLDDAVDPKKDDERDPWLKVMEAKDTLNRALGEVP